MARSNVDRDYPYYPAFLDLCHKTVVVVGGGIVATGKVEGLLPCGLASLRVIAPTVTSAIAAAAARGLLTWESHDYVAGDLAGADLVFAATDDRHVNARVAAEARVRGIWVLAVDDIPSCDFIAPSIVQRGRLTLAVSTGGLSPAIARWVRMQLDSLVPEWWSGLLNVAAAVRCEVHRWNHRPGPAEWECALDEEVLTAVARGELAQANTLLLRRLAAEERESA
ncbi:MAG: bifunctional precorrin-2 dehydrogenase/sirohydrochlorin ferrochelatase [Chloroflexi bacterium]|nr:bifunctional precorrin-2 dehydrogenase/sirohydrochlorin ferrochelatase [Chloroflexota bacterium]